MTSRHLSARGTMAPEPAGYGDPYNYPPTLVSPIADQHGSAGQAFSLVIPEGTFTDADDDPIQYSAMLLSGAALPAWLSFDSSSATFSGTPAAGDAGVLEIRVRANDGGPGGATDDFVLTILGGLVLQGDEGANTLEGGAYADSLSGGAGADSLAGDAGADTLIGGAGPDSLTGGAGADLLQGGDGNDTYTVGAGDVLQEQEAGGRDTVRSGINWTLDANTEALVLTSGALAATGNGLDNAISGNGVANRLYGRAGADTLGGNGGDDVLRGTAGNDTLRGGAGDDSLRGGADADRLIGGDGNDCFVFDAPLDATANVDTIVDCGAGDRIQLDDDAFAGLKAGIAITAAKFASGPGLDHASTSTERLIYDTSSGTLYYDRDGTGAAPAVAFAVLGSGEHPTLGIADFFVIG